MKTLLLAFLSFSLSAQTTTRWYATTGDVVLSGAGTAATIQQPATGATQVILDRVDVYCSVPCNVTQTANATTPATSTAGTITPILPTPLNFLFPFTFWTASNASGGTAQAGIVHLTAAGYTSLCFSTACGNPGNVILGTGGTAANYTVTVSSITGTANVTFYGRSQ